MTPQQLSVLFKTFKLFGIGLSWGGYESLALLIDPLPKRDDAVMVEAGHLLRIHVGLETSEDLINDFSRALTAALGVR
jgi:cystathionine beta-lyase